MRSLLIALVLCACGDDSVQDGGARDVSSVSDGGNDRADAPGADGGRDVGVDGGEDVGSADVGPNVPEGDAATDVAVDVPSDTFDAGGAPLGGCVPRSPLPVVPCGAGFGMETPAGSGRHLTPPQTTLMRVTNLAAAGSGSLRACMEARGPRVCVFEVSGVIDITEDIDVQGDYLTVAGQTAPSPGVAVHGAGIRVRANDVLISHLRIRVGDRADGPPVNGRDAIRISGRGDNPSRIVIDHCSLAFSSDEMASVWYDAQDITFVDTLMGMPLHDSIHVDEQTMNNDDHGYGMLLGHETQRVAVVRTLMAHHAARNPLSRTDGLVFANNVVYNWGSVASELATVAGAQRVRATFVGNSYIAGADSNRRSPLLVRDLPAESALFERDNLQGDPDAPDFVENRGAPSLIVGAPPVTYAAYSPVAAADVESAVLAGAGAWPSARDAVDARIVREVQERRGTIINCVEADGSPRCGANAGGWPSLSENSRMLSPPADPAGDANADGYTNLEAWLWAFGT